MSLLIELALSYLGFAAYLGLCWLLASLGGME